MRSLVSQTCLGLLYMVAAVPSVHANGFSILDKGPVTSGLSNAGATARAADGSTVYFNPAGMTHLPAMWQVGFDLIKPGLNTRNTGTTTATPSTGGDATPIVGTTSNNPIDVTPLPTFYAVYPVAGTNLWLGLAVTVPFGLDLEYRDDWFGRYDSVESRLTTVDLAPSIAWRVTEHFSIGGGINSQYADGTLRSALPDPLNPGGPTTVTDGMSKLQGDDWSIGFNVGLLWQPDEHIRVGAHFRSGIEHSLDGALEVSGLSGPLSTFNGRQPGSTAFNLPAIASLALAWDWSEHLTSFAEVNWFDWSRFKEIRAVAGNGETLAIRPQHYSDTWGVAAGIEYQVNPKWQIRSGVRYEETPTNDQYRTTAIADEQSVTAAVGVSMQLTDVISIDGAYQHFFYANSRIDLVNEFYSSTPLRSVVATRGNLQPDSNVISVGIRFQY